MAGAVGRQLSDEFGIPKTWLRKHAVFDPTLDIDAPLFIDPFLLSHSVHKEFSDCGFDAYETHFGTIFALLRASQHKGDKAWKAALERLRHGEVGGMSGTCLGYSKHSTRGRGFGATLSARAVGWAKEVIDLGVKDPELFSVLPLFEGGIGPDLISDMVASIILECIMRFNGRIIAEIETHTGKKLPSVETEIQGRSARLLRNPFDNRGAPVVLLAADVLKHLPLLEDPRKLANIVDYNKALRGRVNEHISEIFKIRFKREREVITKRAMESGAAFQALLDVLKISESTPYDLTKDPAGLMQWRALADQFSGLHKLTLKEDKNLSRIDRIDAIVIAIIKQFRDLVEDNMMSRIFYVDTKPRHERFAQLLFYAIAQTYCEANGLDVSPESDAGAGPVDFKMSVGSAKIIVEIKLSTNGKTVSGYRSQLDAYAKAERADRGHYVLVDVGSLGNKWKDLRAVARSNPKFAATKKLHLIDGKPKMSASKLV